MNVLALTSHGGSLTVPLNKLANALPPLLKVAAWPNIASPFAMSLLPVQVTVENETTRSTQQRTRQVTAAPGQPNLRSRPTYSRLPLRIGERSAKDLSQPPRVLRRHLLSVRAL